jgi:hypothetical protein
MSFLAPLFVLGALAIAAPILFHLIRRTSKEKIPFSSLMFLQPTPPRVTKKSRLENILLLLLRCAVLALLALAFARPFLRNPLAASNASGAITRTVVLIDTSASMRREGLFDEARDKAREIIRNATAADEIAVFTFDRIPRALVNFDEWKKASLNERKALGESRLAALKPTWNNTHVGNALLAASETLEAERENPTSARRVVLISDMQDGARLEGLQGFQWPKQTQVSVVPVKTKKPANAGLQRIVAASSITAQSNETARVRVYNSSESRQEQFSLRWSGTASNPIAAYVPPGQSRSYDLAKAPDSETIELTGDESDFDNRVFVVTPPREQIEIVFVGNDAETDPQQLLYYLKRAFPDTAQREVRVTVVKPDAAIAASRNASLIVVGATLTGDALRDVSNLLTNGAVVLCPLRSAGEADNVAKLLGTPVTAEEAVMANVSSYAMFTEIDFTHPLFAPFADARFNDFTKIRFWKSRKVTFATTNAHTLAKFDNGAPALAQINTGKGSLFVLGSGWNPGDSQFALSSKFVPLLFSLLEISGAIKAQSLDFHVGDTVDVSALRATNALTIRKPDGTTASLAAGAKNFSETDLPGVYSAAGIEPSFRFAVNLAPEESKTAPLAIEQLEQLGVPVKAPPIATPEQIARREAQLKATELESHQKLWRWLIVATLVVLIVETWVAARLSRKTPATA